MIRSFANKKTEEFFQGGRHRDFANIASVALRKLDQLAGARRLSDLSRPPGNHLEALTDDRLGQQSIRINQQFRICFRWTDEGPQDVETVDYH